MKRIFTFVLSALLAVTFTTASAQQNIFIWKDGGNLAVKSATNVDSLIFEVGSWLLKISAPITTSVTTDKFQATVHISFADNVKSLSIVPEVGVCFSSENETPTYDTAERKRLGTSVKDYDFTIYDLDPGTTYYYRTYVKLEDEVFYGSVRSVTTFGEKAVIKIINGHKFIDLGLPSGLYWAKCNVGAKSETEDGDYYAWGDTEPNGSGCSSATDFKDAATAQWGGDARMPSHEEQEELVSNCMFTWVEDYKGTGVTGSICVGPNGQSIFFPAAGSINGNMVSYRKIGSYWSSSCSDNYWNDPWDMDIRENGAITEYITNFYHLRQSIRPVTE